MKYSPEDLRMMPGSKILIPAEEAWKRREERSWTIIDAQGNQRLLEAVGEVLVFDRDGVGVDDWVFYPAVAPGPDQQPIPEVVCAPHKKLKEWAKDGVPQRLCNIGCGALCDIADFEKDEVIDGYRRKPRRKDEQMERDIHQQCRAMLGYFGMDHWDAKKVHRLYNTLQKAAEEIFKKINLADHLIRVNDVKVIDGFTDAGARLNVITEDGRTLPMNRNAHERG